MEQVKQYFNPITLGRTSAIFSCCPLLLCKNFAYETLVIHRWAFDFQWSYMKDLMTLLHCVCAVQDTLNLKWRSELYWRVCQCLKLRIKNKMRKGNHLHEIEVREVDNEMKRIKIHYKGFRGDTDHMSGVTMVLYLTSKDFTLCLPLLHCNFIRVNFELIFRSGFPSVQQLCQWFLSCLARTSIGRL